MLQVVAIILPVFGLILLGFGLGKRGFFTEGGIQDLSRFIFYLAVPALIFRTGATGLDVATLEPGVLLAYYGPTLGIFGFSLLLARRQLKLGAQEAPVFAMGATFSNLVLVGLPIVQAGFGQAGLVALMTLVSLNTLTFFTLPSLLIELHAREQLRASQALGVILRSIVQNPLVLAIFAGFGWGLSGWDLPYVMDQFTALLGRAASPCALVVVGASLARYRLRGALSQTWLIIGLKLLIAPLLVWLTGHYLVGLSPVWLAVATLSAGLPVGANVFILSQRYGVYGQTASSAILLSTLCAMVTLSLLLAILSTP